MSGFHTPGPWSFVQGGTGNSPTWHVRIGAALVTLPGIFDMKVMDANARLIAAAPELLATLTALHDNMFAQDLTNGIEPPSEDEYRQCMRDAAAVIGKATGSAV